MFRLIMYFILLIILGYFFTWLPHHVSDIILTYQNLEITISSQKFFGGILLIAALLSFVGFFFYQLISIPHYISKYWKRKRTAKAQQALEQGFLAIFSGDLNSYNKLQKNIKKLPDYHNNMFVNILAIQHALLTNQNIEIISLYEKLLKNPHSRLFALHGLYTQAKKNNSNELALTYATQALKVSPQSDWAQQEVITNLAQNNEWDSAINQLNQKSNRTDKNSQNKRKRLKLVLLTGSALYYQDSNPLKAMDNIKKAVKISPQFVPAITTQANLLFNQGKGKKAVQILEKAWLSTAHPNIALLYVERSGYATALEKLKRVERLLTLSSTTPFLTLLHARSLLETGDIYQARQILEELIDSRPTENAYLLLADIEELQTGNKALIKQWLTKARIAPKDATWIGEGKSSTQWLPYSPISGKLDVFEWKTPKNDATPQKTLEKDDILYYHTIESKNNAHEIHILNPDADNMLVLDNPGTQKEERETNGTNYLS
ncbi:heme biosynthesis protein HemY [Bartonella sp. DGB1]|uniref:heme biosynthesis protein HemY n=1 Tax=Bartonella sp. DGB1 TaxID=3239807 RepID=UPI0035245510